MNNQNFYDLLKQTERRNVEGRTFDVTAVQVENEKRQIKFNFKNVYMWCAIELCVIAVLSMLLFVTNRGENVSDYSATENVVIEEVSEVDSTFDTLDNVFETEDSIFAYVTPCMYIANTQESVLVENVQGTSLPIKEKDSNKTFNSYVVRVDSTTKDKNAIYHYSC